MKQSGTIFWVAFWWMIVSPFALAAFVFLCIASFDAEELASQTIENWRELLPWWYGPVQSIYFIAYTVFVYFAFRQILHRCYNYTGADRPIVALAALEVVFRIVNAFDDNLYTDGFGGPFVLGIVIGIPCVLAVGGLYLWLARALEPLGANALFGLNAKFVQVYFIAGWSFLIVITACAGLIGMVVMWILFLIVFYRAARAGGESQVEWETVDEAMLSELE